MRQRRWSTALLHSLDLGSGPHVGLCGRRLARVLVSMSCPLVQGARVISWANGPFEAGKTTLAGELAHRDGR